MVDLQTEYLGCGNHSCILEKTKGLGTNGGCSCLRDLRFKQRIRVEKLLKRLREEIEELKEKDDV